MKSKLIKPLLYLVMEQMTLGSIRALVESVSLLQTTLDYIPLQQFFIKCCVVSRWASCTVNFFAENFGKLFKFGIIFSDISKNFR